MEMRALVSVDSSCYSRDGRILRSTDSHRPHCQEPSSGVFAIVPLRKQCACRCVEVPESATATAMDEAVNWDCSFRKSRKLESSCSRNGSLQRDQNRVEVCSASRDSAKSSKSRTHESEQDSREFWKSSLNSSRVT